MVKSTPGYEINLVKTVFCGIFACRPFHPLFVEVSEVTMDAYVQVSNDVSLAVKSILQVKKSFRSQMHCVKQLLQHNRLLKNKLCELEKSNKELRSMLLLSKQNNELQKQVLKLENDKKKQEYVVNDFISGSQNDDTCGFDGIVEINHDKMQGVQCPKSPPSSPSTRSKRENITTPQKSTSTSNRKSWKSRRVLRSTPPKKKLKK